MAFFPRRRRFLYIVILAGIIFFLLWRSPHQSPEMASRVDTPPRDRPRGRAGAVDANGEVLLDPADRGVGGGDAAGGAGGAPAQAQHVAERLKEAEQKAKDEANHKAPLKPDSPSEVIGVGSSADGNANANGSPEEEEKETREEHEAEQELGAILKRAPVIIFSKSYCMYSKRAKALLLERYAIDPAPHVVELDLHPLGQQLQSMLEETTGRRTVPNIMINGVSIGGSDDVAELDARGELVGKIKDLGSTRGVAMKLRS